MTVELWLELRRIIKQLKNNYDGRTAYRHAETNRRRN